MCVQWLNVICILQGKVVAQGTFEDILDLATVEEDNYQSVILRDVLSEMLGEDSDDEEMEVEEQNADNEPDSPLPSPALVRKPTFRKPELIRRRVTDLSLMRQASFTRQPSFLRPKLPPIFPHGQLKTQMSQPSSSKLRRRSVSKPSDRWLQRRSTVATVGTDGRRMSASVGVKHLRGGPLAALAACMCKLGCMVCVYILRIYACAYLCLVVLIQSEVSKLTSAIQYAVKCL